MTSKQVLEELKKAGSENIKKIMLKHGGREPLYGVKVEEMKKIMKKVKDNHQEIALDLYKSGVGDAQYLAGLMADGSKMSGKQLQEWAENAGGQMMSEYTVPWVTAENKDAFALGLKWIDSKKDYVACSGWSTLGGVLAMRPDTEIDIKMVQELMTRVQKQIHTAPNRVRYCMNGFLIAAGSYVKALHKPAIDIAKKIGEVTINMGETACKVPSAPEYIKAAVARGTLEKKKKTLKC